MATYAELASKIVLITGSSKALGAETARAFARQGSRVVVSGRDTLAIERVVEFIRDEGGEAIGLVADVTNTADIENLRECACAQFGLPDVLVCFAGGMGQPLPVLTMDEGVWRRTLDVDLTAKFLTVRAFAPAMRDRGSGSIILMGSASGRLVSEASAAYGAAQAGTLMLMRHLAQELGPAGVRVNAVAPAAVRNEKMERSMPVEMQRKVAAGLPLRRLGEPADVASATLFLASDAARWLTGITLDVTGGKVML